ncbi:hypothetical protein FRACYDRAFT_243490 [Fragilariopsis cylindrus CCMP1102]|uniref:Uncharacterized protein n=1 Tax=Fragilariopsis cylindrus CCMP1102 TaxID=635003 RepID=A0A1E7F4D3_9STRA|nr:hypothetical protein FRACYDRAFT_243490 [Fragilariopsis cylindrus CCMP1102]|eukprot:OEU13007.1 hypothetical protein FRACYDRAFT_243490 [Fragilariopsis cylindrus CCMP1102]
MFVQSLDVFVSMIPFHQIIASTTLLGLPLGVPGTPDGEEIDHDAPLAALFVAKKEVALQFKGIVFAAADRGALALNQNGTIQVLEKCVRVVFGILFLGLGTGGSRRKDALDRAASGGLDDGVFVARNGVGSIVAVFEVGPAQKDIQGVGSFHLEGRHVDPGGGDRWRQQQRRGGADKAREKVLSRHQRKVIAVANSIVVDAVTIVVVIVIDAARWVRTRQCCFCTGPCCEGRNETSVAGRLEDDRGDGNRPAERPNHCSCEILLTLVWFEGITTLKNMICRKL